jgi:hypothetical protein
MTTGDKIQVEYAAIAAGSHFWCETHLAAVPVTEQSADPRYCRDCYDFLCHELELMMEHRTTKRPAWIPDPLPEALRAVLLPTAGGQKACDTGMTLSTGMSQTVTCENGAQHGLDDAILGLAGQSLGCRAIADELCRQGYSITYRSVARHLKKLRREKP